MANRLYTSSNHRCGQPELEINYSIDLQHRSGKKTKQVDIGGLFSVQIVYDTRHCTYNFFSAKQQPLNDKAKALGTDKGYWWSNCFLLYLYDAQYRVRHLLLNAKNRYLRESRHSHIAV